MPRLKDIFRLRARLHLVSSLNIGTGPGELLVGSVDSSTLRNPITSLPYIPGSTLKGRMRGLLESVAAVPTRFSTQRNAPGTNQNPVHESIEALFGPSPKSLASRRFTVGGSTRLSFWDCPVNQEWSSEQQAAGVDILERRTELEIDRGTGQTIGRPRLTECVAAGAIFDFNATLSVFEDEELLPLVLDGLKLLEWEGIGSGTSRGRGRLHFEDLRANGVELQALLDERDNGLFKSAP